MGDWPLTKLHQPDPINRMYTYCLTRPRQARDQPEGKEKPVTERKQTAEVRDLFNQQNVAMPLEPPAEMSLKPSGQESRQTYSKMA